MYRVLIGSVLSVNLAFGAATAASAFLAQPLLVDQHSGEAEVICAGRIIGSSVGARQADGSRHISYVLKANRIIKGAVPAGAELHVEYVTPDGYPRHLLRGYDLVYLKRQGALYTFARRHLSSMPAAEKIHIPRPEGGDIMALLRWEVINSLHDKDREVVRQALRQTSMLSYDDMLRYVKPRTTAEEVPIRNLAYQACLEAGDSTVISPAIGFAVEKIQKSGSRGVSEAMDTEIALQHVRLGEDHIRQLTALLTPDSARVRRFASLLLRRGRDVSVAPVLKGLLNDPDLQVRYNAVVALSDLFRDFTHGPSLELFKRNEASYISYWKNWKPAQK